MNLNNKLKPKKKSKTQRFVQGYFKPKNIEKFRGNPYSIIFRSSLEKKFCNILDNSENVKTWSTESVAIKYKNPIDGKIHTYYPDFLVEHMVKDSKITKKIMYEIKASSFLKKPERINFKDNGKYKYALMNYIIIMEKKKSAEEFCRKHGYEYKFITERNFK